MPQPRITRDDVTSMIRFRQELGEEMEPGVVDAFIERVYAAIQARAAEKRLAPLPDSGTGERLAPAIVSLGTGIPITAIAAEARRGAGHRRGLGGDRRRELRVLAPAPRLSATAI